MSHLFFVGEALSRACSEALACRTGMALCQAWHTLWGNTFFYHRPSDSLRGSSVKIGTIQRRLAWPLRKDDTQIREAFQIFFVACVAEWLERQTLNRKVRVRLPSLPHVRVDSAFHPSLVGTMSSTYVRAVVMTVRYWFLLYMIGAEKRPHVGTYCIGHNKPNFKLLSVPIDNH